MGTVLKFAAAFLRGLYDAARNGKRRQDIRTPQWFVDAASEALGGSIPLDPCATRSPRWHFAEENWSSRGLDRPWERPSFANPRYDNLVAWMEHAQAEAARTGLPQIFLGPWRTHRHGFFNALARSEVIFFRAFPFVGQRNSAPFPCFAAVRHCTFPATAYEFGRRPW